MKKSLFYLLLLCLLPSSVAAQAQLTGITPNDAEQATQDLEVTITGTDTHFGHATNTTTVRVWLEKGIEEIDASTFSSTFPTILDAEFDLPSDASIGFWDLWVQTVVDGSLSLTNGFKINPATPSSLSVVAIGNQDIDLSWTNNAVGHNGFKIERKLGSGGQFSEIDTVGPGTTYYQDNGLVASTVYCYQVRAYQSSNHSGYSNEDCDTTDQPTIAINNPSPVTESNSGTVNLDFSVTISALSSQTVTVNYATQDETATAGSDYQAISTTGLTFQPGQQSKTVTVVVYGDLLDELNETLLVNLSDPGNAALADGQGQGIIIDNDNPPSIAINNKSVPEGNAGTVDANFTVNLSNPSSFTVTVDYETTDGTAAAGSDYLLISTTTLTFQPGQESNTVTVTVFGDQIDEANETFYVDLSNPGNASINDDRGLGTIFDDDDPPSISIDNITVGEGDASTAAAEFTVSLSTESGRNVTVDYMTSDGTATAGSDYLLISTTTLTFQPGQESNTVTVTVFDDQIDEANETFYVDLSNPGNASINDNQGLGTIIDDDPTPGDIDDDDDIDLQDLELLIDHILMTGPQLSGYQFVAADMDNDEQLTALDLVLLINEFDR